MLSKRKINKVSDIALLIYLGVMAVINFIKFTPELIDLINKYDFSIIQITMMIFIQLVSSTILSIMSNYFILIAYVAIKFANKTAKNDNLNKIDLGKYKGYYRDIIEEYSPAILSFIDDFEVDYKKDVVATLLGLKLKNNIELNNNEIKVINSDSTNLDTSEKYVLENKIQDMNKFTFTNKVIEDAIAKGLVVPMNTLKQKSKKRILRAVLLFLISYGAMWFLPSIAFNELLVWQLALLVIIMLFFIIYPLFSIIYLIAYIAKSAKVNYVRTKKGEEINEMLEGLKNYIKNYSILDERDANDLVLWENYLIYSVLFGQNTKIVDDIFN